MNALVKHTDDPFAMLDQAIGVDMDGDLFRFNAKLGTYFEGQEKKIVPIGRKLKFAPLSIQDGYQKWIDGKMIDERWRSWVNEHPIIRNDLGDFPEDAEFKDVWGFTLRAAFRHMTGARLKFVTTSTGGINAIRRVLRAWKAARDSYPDLVPVVTIGTESYVHKVHRTEIITPTFEIVDWAPWDSDKPKLKAVEGPEPDQAEGQSIGGVLDDEIPFACEWRA